MFSGEHIHSIEHTPDETDLAIMYRSGLELQAMYDASTTYAQWLSIRSQRRNTVSNEPVETIADRMMIRLCEIHTSVSTPERQHSRFQRFRDEFDEDAANIYQSMTETFAEIHERSRQKGDSITTIDRLRIMFAGIQFHAYSDLLTGPHLDKKAHVKTAATLITQFDTHKRFLRAANRYAQMRSRDARRQGLPEPDRDEDVALCMAALFQLNSPQITEREFTETWGEQSGYFINLYAEETDALADIAKRSERKARHMNPRERLILAWRAANVLLNKNTPLEYKQTIKREFAFTDEDGRNVVHALKVSGPIMLISTAFSLLGPLAMAHEFIPAPNTPLGHELIKWSYYANYALSFGASLVFRKALIEMGTAPNILATQGFQILKKLLPENVTTQSLGIILMTFLPSLYDDPIAATTLLKGSSMVFTRNALTSIFALSAAILSLWQLRNYRLTGKHPEDHEWKIGKRISAVSETS